VLHAPQAENPPAKGLGEVVEELPDGGPPQLFLAAEVVGE